MSALRPIVTLYMHHDCHLCSEARAELQSVRSELDFELVEVDIHSDDALLRAYCERVPVIALDGRELCELRLDRQLLRGALLGRGAARPPAGCEHAATAHLLESQAMATECKEAT
jgi:glutaredoxin